MGDGSLSTGPGAQQVVEAVAFPDGDVAYFDTIAWNRLLDHPNRGRLITTMRASGVHVIASVFNAAEVAQTRDPERRRKLGAIVREVHGDGPLLEHPLMMAVPMADVGFNDLWTP